jgi:hypothetical protein
MHLVLRLIVFGSDLVLSVLTLSTCRYQMRDFLRRLCTTTRFRLRCMTSGLPRSNLAVELLSLSPGIRPLACLGLDQISSRTAFFALIPGASETYYSSRPTPSYHVYVTLIYSILIAPSSRADARLHCSTTSRSSSHIEHSDAERRNTIPLNGSDMIRRFPGAHANNGVLPTHRAMPSMLRCTNHHHTKRSFPGKCSLAPRLCIVTTTPQRHSCHVEDRCGR